MSSSRKSDLIIALALGMCIGIVYSKVNNYSKQNNNLGEAVTYFVKHDVSRYPIPEDELRILFDTFQLKKEQYPDYARKTSKCILFPIDWTFADRELRCVANTHSDFFHHNLISACLMNHDMITCKATLARLSKNLLPKKSLEHLPKSWLLDELHTIPKLAGVLLIAKTNRQRQSSTLIFDSSDVPELQKLHDNGIVVVQELIKSPFCIGDRKTTLRVYVLAFVSSSKRTIWRYSNGFIYYSDADYDKSLSTTSAQVASGYSDRTVYDTRPLTLNDLWKTLSRCESAEMSAEIDNCIKNTIGLHIRNENVIQTIPQGSFQLFGCDVLIQNNEQPFKAFLLEVNKAPDLTYKSERDGQLKRNLINDMWRILAEPAYLNLLSCNDHIHLQRSDNDTWLTL